MYQAARPQTQKVRCHHHGHSTWQENHHSNSSVEPAKAVFPTHHPRPAYSACTLSIHRQEHRQFRNCQKQLLKLVKVEEALYLQRAVTPPQVHQARIKAILQDLT